MSGRHDELEQLEAQVEAELARLGGRLGVALPEGLIERTSAQVRLELHEAWLAEQPDPEPSPALLLQVRELLAAELRSGRANGSTASRQGHWWMPSGRTGGALAAAAMLLLCVGLIRTAGRGSFGGQREAGNAASVSESVNLFVQAAETAFAGDTFSAATISELEGIGQRISGWPESSQSQDDELEAVMQNLMEAFEQADHAAEGALG